MKKVLIILLGIILLGAIGFGVWYVFQQKSSGTFHKTLSTADTMEIIFTDAKTNKVYKKTIQSQPAVWLVTGTISDQSVPNMKCEFNGTVQFFSKGTALLVQPAAISLDPQCQQIAFSYAGKIYHKRFLIEGLDYLQGLEAELKK